MKERRNRKSIVNHFDSHTRWLTVRIRESNSKRLGKLSNQCRNIIMIEFLGNKMAESCYLISYDINKQFAGWGHVLGRSGDMWHFLFWNHGGPGQRIIWFLAMMIVSLSSVYLSRSSLSSQSPSGVMWKRLISTFWTEKVSASADSLTLSISSHQPSPEIWNLSFWSPSSPRESMHSWSICDGSWMFCVHVLIGAVFNLTSCQLALILKRTKLGTCVQYNNPS